MTGLDTNVVVRFFIEDNKMQGAAVRSIVNSLSEQEPGWIGTAVLMEFVWVLTNSYGATRVELANALDNLLSRREILLEQQEAVRQALQVYERTNVGFADCLIATSAKAAGCSRIWTFDKDAAKSTGMTLVT
jgi:predicted nucleic-acid-binding protein